MYNPEYTNHACFKINNIKDWPKEKECKHRIQNLVRITKNIKTVTSTVTHYKAQQKTVCQTTRQECLITGLTFQHLCSTAAQQSTCSYFHAAHHTQYLTMYQQYLANLIPTSITLISTSLQDLGENFISPREKFQCINKWQRQRKNLFVNRAPPKNSP